MFDLNPPVTVGFSCVAEQIDNKFVTKDEVFHLSQYKDNVFCLLEKTIFLFSVSETCEVEVTRLIHVMI